MPSIDENRYFTPIIEFEVSPENQEAMINGIADEVERRFKRYPRFVSASFHASEDGRRVINYAQWTSKEAWIASGRTSDDDEATVAILEVLKRYGAKPTRGQVDFFRVVRVVEKDIDNK